MGEEGWGYLVVWEFLVRREAEKAFEEAYGLKGVWAEFFRKDAGYVRTDLVRDHKAEGRYLTMDFWTTREAYVSFRERHSSEYSEIDRCCERLTESEAEIGSFERVH